VDPYTEHRTLLSSVEGRIALVTINRPEKLNALNAEAKGELRDLFGKIRTDNDVDVVVLTGAGEKAFVSGTDIAELASLDRKTGEEFAAGGQSILDMIERLGKPVIAAVNGYALGGGCELALACHIRLASDNAKFGQPEVRLGATPGYGGTRRLARLIGHGRALEMILSGAMIDAGEALRIGLVNRVVPRAELMDAAMQLARLIASNSQVAVRLALEGVNHAAEMTVTQGQRLEAELFGRCCDSEDFHEGVRAFLTKRKPLFKGR